MFKPHPRYRSLSGFTDMRRINGCGAGQRSQTHPGILKHLWGESHRGRDVCEQLFGTRGMLRNDRWIDRWENRLLTACFQSCLLYFVYYTFYCYCICFGEGKDLSPDMGSFSARKLELKARLWLLMPVVVLAEVELKTLLRGI